MKSRRLIGAIALAGYMFTAFHLGTSGIEILNDEQGDEAGPTIEVVTSTEEAQEKTEISEVIIEEKTQEEPTQEVQELIEIIEKPTKILVYNEYPSYWNKYLNNVIWVEAGLETGIDPKLLMAIAIHETGNFDSYIFRTFNNVGGNLNDSSNPYKFNSFGEGVMFMAKNLKTNNAYRNIDWSKSTTSLINDIQKIYAPVGAYNDPNSLNTHWVSGVTKYYSRIANNTVISGRIDYIESVLYI